MLIEWLDGHSLQRGVLKEEGKTKLKVETLTGRIVSLPAKRFHLKHSVSGDVSDFFSDIDRESHKVDCELLHSAVDPHRSYSLGELAGEWFSLDHPQTRERSIILSACLGGQPWFRVDSSGSVKVSGEEEIRRWKKELEVKARFIEEREHIEDVICRALHQSGEESFPDPELLSLLKNPFLDYLTAKTSFEEWPSLQSAVERISAREQLSHASLIRRVMEAGGILPSPYHIHMAKFHQAFFLKPHEEDHEFLPGRSRYPDITEKDRESLLETLRKTVDDLPAAQPDYIFSIDHSSTEEIDDALSAEEVDDQTFRVGIHIAAPGALISEECAIHGKALERSTTVYQPDCKWTMLPREVIAAFSLKEGQPKPVVSAYYLVDRSTLTLKSVEFRWEKLIPTANLGYDFLEESLTDEFVPGLSKVRKDPDYFKKLAAEDRSLWPNDVPQSLDKPLREAVRILVPFSRELFFHRHRDQIPFVRGREYVILVTQSGQVEVELRRRNSLAENIVAELMILMNSRTAEFLASSGCPSVYRTQRPDMPDLKRGRSRADLTVNPREHGGIGASLYCWATSPLRRYADLINQRQLASLLGGPLPTFRDESELLIRAKKAEFLNQASLNHQRRMERYWILKYLEQHGEDAHPVNLHPRDRSILVAFEEIPLHLNISREEASQAEGPALFSPESFDFYSLEVRGKFMPKQG